MQEIIHCRICFIQRKKKQSKRWKGIIYVAEHKEEDLRA